MIDGYRAYRFYLATKLHFTTPKYNVFESKGAVTCSREAFEKRNDKFIFGKLGQRFNTEREYIQFLAANFIYGNTDVIYSGSESDDNYIEWQRRKQSITKIFQDDMDTIMNCGKPLDEVLNCTNNQIPYIISLLVSKRITIESVVILDEMMPFIAFWNNAMIERMFSRELLIVHKARGFVKYNKDKIKPIIETMHEEMKSGTHAQEVAA